MITKSFFFFNCHCDLDLDPNSLKRKLIRGIVISNTCVKLYRNWIIDEVARVMTICEYTNVRTYVRTGQNVYPLHNFDVRGDNSMNITCKYKQ